MTHSALGILSGRATSGTVLAPGVVLDDASIGRIEEWVVSTLDDRNKPSADAEWKNSLENLTLTKRTGKPRDTSSNTPTSQGPWARFRLSQRRGIAIVSLTDQALIKEEDLLELTGDLLALVEAGHRRIVLDFFAVERLFKLGRQRARRRPSGAVMTTEGTVDQVLGDLVPSVAAIFAMTGLDPSVVTYPDTASAVDGVVARPPRASAAPRLDPHGPDASRGGPTSPDSDPSTESRTEPAVLPPLNLTQSAAV